MSTLSESAVVSLSDFINMYIGFYDELSNLIISLSSSQSQRERERECE